MDDSGRRIDGEVNSCSLKAALIKELWRDDLISISLAPVRGGTL